MAQQPTSLGGASRLKAVSTYVIEVLRREPTTILLLKDRGQAMDTAGITGVLTVLGGGSAREATLTPLGDNQLEARLQIDAGASAVAVLTLPDQRVLTIPFTAPLAPILRRNSARGDGLEGGKRTL